MNSAARLIVCLPLYSHISTYMTDALHWLPIASRIQYKVLLVVLRTQQGLAPKYLCNLMHKPVSSPPLQSADQLDLLVPQSWTGTVLHRAFAIVGPSMWNDLPPSIRSKILVGVPPSSLHCLKTFLFPRAITLRAPLNS